MLRIKFNKYIQSDIFIVFFALFIFIMSLFNISTITLSLTALMLSIIFATQKNLKPVLVPFGLVYFGIYTIKGKYNFNWFFFLSIGILVVSIIYYCIKNKPKLKLSYCVITFIPYVFSYSLSGLFSPHFNVDYPYYTNILLFLLGIFIILLFLLLVNTVEINNKDFIMKLFIAVGTIILLQLLYRLIFEEGFVHLIKNDRVELNWGIYSGVITSFLFSIPACFYFAIKKTKYNYLFLILMHLFTASVFLTGSRAGMIGLTIETLILDVLILFLSKNKKVTNIIILSLFSLIIIALIIMYIFFNDFFDSIFYSFIDSGIGSSSRLRAWEMSREFFLENPIFGIGLLHNFYDMHGVVDFMWLSHNTFLQALSSLGIVGFIALLIHIYAKYRVCMKKTSYHISCLIMIIGTGLYGLIDCTYPAPYMLIPLFITLISLDIINKNDIKK